VQSRLSRSVLLLAALFVAFGAAARAPSGRLATGRIAVTQWPYLPGSSIPLRVSGFAPPFSAVLLGPGRIAGDNYEIPSGSHAGTTTLVLGNAAGLAASNVRIAHTPPANRSLLVVASYDDGLVFHDAATFSVLGVLATGGTPTDVAVDPRGRIATPDTQGTALTLATLAPWNVTKIEGVAVGDEVAIVTSTQAIFVTDRDVNGNGALTRVSAQGAVARVTTGATAEGLTIDEGRQIVYVANANDGTIAAVDARSMRLLRRIPAVDRVFSLVLSPDGDRLYAVSNQSANSPFAAAGSVVALALRGSRWHVVARSGALAFPLGAALDPRTSTLFVTDEERAQVDVLDARTLRAKRPPLQTCAIPWQPLLDVTDGRLYVPCAGADAIDAFDAPSLRRLHHAPFATGSYPLAIAAWRPTELFDSAQGKLRRVSTSTR
jgi:DNA-binding beta-propeller fold protein YncE